MQRIYTSSTDNRYGFYDREFFEKNNTISHLTVPIEEVLYRLNSIETIVKNHKAEESLILLTNLCLELLKHVPLMVSEIDVPFVLRSREGYKNDGKVFSSIADFSYSPFPGLNRFSQKGELLFYGSLPSITEKGDTALSSILESNKDITNPMAEIQDWYSTVSRWDVRKTFFAINLSLGESAIKNNITAKRIDQLLKTIVFRRFSPPSVEILQLVWSYFSKKAGVKRTDDDEYFVTIAFKNAAKMYYGNDIKAIMFSSSASENSCMNIAIEKEMIDQGLLNLHGAIVYKIKSHPYLKKRSVYPCSNYATPDCYGNFKIEI